MPGDRHLCGVWFPLLILGQKTGVTGREFFREGTFSSTTDSLADAPAVGKKSHSCQTGKKYISLIPSIYQLQMLLGLKACRDHSVFQLSLLPVFWEKIRAGISYRRDLEHSKDWGVWDSLSSSTLLSEQKEAVGDHWVPGDTEELTAGGEQKVGINISRKLKKNRTWTWRHLRKIHWSRKQENGNIWGMEEWSLLQLPQIARGVQHTALLSWTPKLLSTLTPSCHSWKGPQDTS